MSVDLSRIDAEVDAGMRQLPPHLRTWINAHRIPPTKARLSSDHEGPPDTDVWMVTAHTGNRDSSCRLYFDPTAQAFGVEMTLQNGVCWAMGVYGSFVEAVNSM